jgi:hypothetical protein
METNEGKTLTQFHCPDCGTVILLDLNGSESKTVLLIAKQVRCVECSQLRRDYDAASVVAVDALRRAEVLASNLRQQTKNGEEFLTITQKESVWKNKQKLERSMEVYRIRLSRMRQASSSFMCRTGMKLK